MVVSNHITTTNWTGVWTSAHLSITHVVYAPKTSEEMGELGLPGRQVSQIEPSSILAPGYADARHLFCNARAHNMSGVVSMLPTHFLEGFRYRLGQMHKSSTILFSNS